MLSRCWTAWSLSSARGRFHWNTFRGSWGIWQPLSRHSDCFIWDRFSVGFTTGSRDGHGNTATVAYINRQGGLRSPSHVPTRPAISSFGVRSIWGLFAPFMSQASSIGQPMSSCVSPPFQGEWRLPPRDSPADLEILRGCSGRPVWHWHTGTQLASGTYANMRLPLWALLAQTLCKVREHEKQVLLVAPYWPNQTWFPELIIPATAPSLANSSEEGSPLS